MDDELEYKAYSSITVSRWVMVAVLVFFGFTVYVALFSEIEFGFITSSIILVVSTTLEIFVAKSPAVDSLLVPKCPKCDGVLEKDKVPGMKMPLKCPSCGLAIRNKEITS